MWAESTPKLLRMSKTISSFESSQTRGNRDDEGLVVYSELAQPLAVATAKECHVAVSRARHFQAHLAIGRRERTSKGVHRFEL